MMKYLLACLFLFSYQTVLAGPYKDFQGVKGKEPSTEDTEMVSPVENAIQKSEFCCDREVKQGNAHDLSPQEVHHLVNGSLSKKPGIPKDSGQR